MEKIEAVRPLRITYTREVRTAEELRQVSDETKALMKQLLADILQNMMMLGSYEAVNEVLADMGNQSSLTKEELPLFIASLRDEASEVLNSIPEGERLCRTE